MKSMAKKTRNDLIAELHRELRAAYSGQWFDDTDSLMKRELNALFDEVGEQRAVIGVRNYIRNEPFFNVARLRAYIPAAAEHSPRCCEYCEPYGGGFIEVAGDHPKLPHVAKCLHNGKMLVGTRIVDAPPPPRREKITKPELDARMAELNGRIARLAKFPPASKKPVTATPKAPSEPQQEEKAKQP